MASILVVPHAPRAVEAVTRALAGDGLEVPAAGAAGGPEWIIGRSAAMRDVYRAVGRIAGGDVSVLLLGETGTGKELVARALGGYGAHSGPFVPVNCAALPEALLETELFGHERGAFTGAERRHRGRFERARGGTLFLDEVGDMAPATQAKLLRVLEDGRFERVGGEQAFEAKVRVVAATNQDLEALIAAGRFRLDLYYRLNGFTIRLPPLRERPGNVRLVAEHFVRRFGGGPAGLPTWAPEALAALESYAWPGNVRELEHAVRHALVHAGGGPLTPGCLPEAVRSPSGAAAPARAAAPALPAVIQLLGELLAAGDRGAYRRVCAAVDRAVLEEALARAAGNQVRASELLGMSRNTLRAKLRQLGLTNDDRPGTAP